MIPYFHLASFSLGPVTFQVWGTFVALGFIAAILCALIFLKRRGLNHEAVWDIGFAGLVGAVIGARLGHVFFYEWHYYAAHAAEIFYVWKPGYSFFGGLFGVIAGYLIVARIKKLDYFKYADALAFAAPLGIAIGRIGCFLINDHPGIRTSLFLGVHYPLGDRFDLGLMESAACAVIFVIFVIVARKMRTPGFLTGLFLILYGAARFGLDFLRIWDGPAAEARYAGLTPAQYFSVLIFIAGIALLLKLRTKKINVQPQS